MSFFIKVEINEVTQNLSAVESIIYSFVKEWIKRYGRPYDQGLLFMQENMPFKTTTRTLINNIRNLEKYSILCTKKSIGGNTLISIILLITASIMISISINDIFKETEKYNKSSVIKGILLGIIIGLLTFILT